MTYTCDVDGYLPTGTQGGERYWHCEGPSVAVLPDGTQLCPDHLAEHEAAEGCGVPEVDQHP